MAEKKKILLVDDDPDFVEAVRVIVESGGYDVRVAYDGKEGLEAVAEEKPDLILLDLVMPHKPGERILKEVIQEYPDLLIIVISGIARTRYGTAPEPVSLSRDNLEFM